MYRTVYDNCKTLIAAGRYDYDEMMSNLALFLMVHLITQDQLVELSGLMTPPEGPPIEGGFTPAETGLESQNTL